MKKIYPVILTICAFFLLSNEINAQYTMPSGGKSMKVYTTGGTFYDNGGISGNFAQNSYDTITFYPKDNNYLQITFDTLDLGEDSYLYVFDGPTAEQDYETYTFYSGFNTDIAITSSNPSGAITFVLLGNTPAPGWKANIKSNAGVRVGVNFNQNYLHCSNIILSYVLENISNNNLSYNYNSRYINEWIIDGKHYSTYFLPDDTLKEGQHNYEYYAVDTYITPYDTLGRAKGSFFSEPFKIISSSGPQACPNEQINFHLNKGDQYVNWNYDTTYFESSTFHTFVKAKTYTIKAAFTDFCDLSDTLSYLINVTNSAVSKPEIIVNGGNTFCPGENLTFSTFGTYNNYLWDFGDGTTASGNKVNHIYKTRGDKTISLKVQNTCNRSVFGTNTNVVHVDTGIMAYAGFSFQSLYNYSCSIKPVQFNGSGVGSFKWSFGDGDSSTLVNPIHIYPDYQNYTVKLNVTNACNKTATISYDVYPESGYSNIYFNLKPKNSSGLIYNGFDTIFTCIGKSIEIINSYSISEPVSYNWYVNGSSKGSLNSCFVQSDTTGNFTVKLVTTTATCGKQDSATINIVFTDTIKPTVTLATYPPSLCPGEKVYFFDNHYKPENNYVYDIICNDGDSVKGITNIADKNLLTFYSKSAYKTFAYTFRARNECNNYVSLKDTIIVNKDASSVPFYYVSNSTTAENKEMLKDYSMRLSPSDMEINVTVKMSSWNSSMDSTVYVYFFKDKYDSLRSSPIGFVKAKGDLAAGVPVKAYLAYETGMKTFGIAGAYYCDKTDINSNPSSKGVPGSSMLTFSFVAGGKPSFPDINLPNPSCSPIMGTWQGVDGYGRKVVANFSANNSYTLSINESTQSMGIFSGNAGYYKLKDLYSCYDSAFYSIAVTADTLRASTTYNDVCSGRYSSLVYINFVRDNTIKNETFNTTCPGDLVSFKAAGGTSYMWDFGDKTYATEQYPLHSYAAPGKYLAKAIITNACGRKDTVISPVVIDTVNKPFDIYIEVDNYNITAGKTATFNVRTYDKDKSSFKYAWYVDGILFGSGEKVTYTFMTPGQYNVKLISSNGCGIDSTEQFFNVEGQTCYATFVTRNAGSSTYEFETPLKGAQQYSWTFDSDTTINTSSSIITYKFSRLAEHSVNLKVTLADGSSCDYTGYVNDASCNSNFDAVSLMNKTIQFTGNSKSTTDIVNSWRWDFGDGTIDSGKIVTHVFPGVGYYKVTLYTNGTFCKSSIYNWVYVEGTPCVQPTFSKVRSGPNFEFKIINPVNGVEYSWDFGDGSNYQYGNSVSHEFIGDDVYYVSVYSHDSINLCSEYFTDTVIIGNAGCMAYFSYNNDYDNHVEFYNYSTLGNYLWNFGDGNTSKEVNPTHNYSQKGIYEVSLVVSDGTCSRKLTSTVVAGKFECQANFTYTVGADRTVTFKNTSTGSPNSFYWDFDDWNNDNAENPIHKFAKDGIYNVYFTVYNELTLCYDEIYKEIRIGDLSSLTSADFFWSYGADNKTINFTNKSSANASSWYWTYGDGSYDSGSNVSHTYEAAGIYDVCLTIYNNTNNTTDKKCDKVTAGESTCDVDASFVYMIDTKNDSVKFTDKSTGKYDTRSWDFGDGTTSSDINPSHKYKSPGFYLVSLAVKLSNSYCIDYYADFIQVGAVDCKAEFSYIAANDGTVKFTNASATSGSANYYWYFDDGGSSTDANPTHKFTNGMHYVFLTVADATGTCMDSKDEEIQVGKVDCSAEFSTFVDISNLTVTCKNKTIGKSTDYYWYFGDGSVSTDTSPVHTFDYPGYYTVSLTTFDDSSWCMDEFETELLIGNPGRDCQADFFYKVDNTTKKVAFSDNSKGDIVKWLWDFGDDSIPASTTNKNPEHLFNAGGYYNVCLTVTNNLGISNMSCKWIKVAADKNTDCVADFTYKVTPDKKMVKLVSKSLGNPNSYVWDFGDDNQSTKNDSSTHTYNDIGYYLISLKISTADGCESNTYKLINVGKPNKQISASFGYNAKHYDFKAGGYPVDFGGAGIGDNSRLRWTFGDGSENSTSMTPVHVYLNPGKYEVCFEYADSVTKQAVKTCKFISTEEKCQDDSIKPVAKCKDTTIVITGASMDIDPRSIDNSSTDDCGIYSLSLDNKRFYPANAGDNTIHLTVTDYNKNTSTCPATVHVIKGEGVNGLSIVSGLKAYPNPIESKVTITYNLNISNNVDLAVFDLLGKRITTIVNEDQTFGLKTINYDATALKSGSYILQIKTSSGNTHRLMVIKK